jgi:hypothetical protein
VGQDISVSVSTVGAALVVSRRWRSNGVALNSQPSRAGLTFGSRPSGPGFVILGQVQFQFPLKRLAGKLSKALARRHPRDSPAYARNGLVGFALSKIHGRGPALKRGKAVGILPER